MRQYLIITVIAVALIGFGILYMRNMNPNQNMTAGNGLRNQTTSQTESNIVPEENMNQEKNIVEIASSDDNFSTLVTAVKTAGLVETLSSEGPFTVFAPTNEAFAKLPKETLDAVLADKEQLTAILTYHVVSGKVMAKDVVNLESAKTVQGGSLKIETVGGNVMIDNAKVINADIEAKNGVIHVIDTVLIPR